MSGLAMMVFSVALALYSGLLGLSLAMVRHFKQVFNKKPTVLQQRLFYWGGWLLLLLGLVLAMKGWGISIGIAAWFGLFSFIGGLLIWLLPYQPKIAWWLAMLALVILLGLALNAALKVIF